MINIICTIENHVALIELNNPPLNTLSQNMIAQLVAELECLEKQDDVHVVLLKSACKVFSAGADLKELFVLGHYNQKFDPMNHWQNVACFTKPIIGFVQGACLGGGLELAMMCDFIVASENASFGFPEINLNLIPGGGGTEYAKKFLSPSKIAYLMMSGQKIDAKTAKEWGLVVDVFPEEVSFKKICEMTQDIASKSLRSLQIIKKTIGIVNKENIEKERFEFYQLLCSEEGKKGIEGFLNKK
ncbi:MAG: hypothetical protein C0432_03375 [Candidatus Puniceispirillum sp.]|nr:hypothetical protein [Candidatus Pelagibacter sp.]MBA4283315.1 hypothetical protein [Candidatus Puniceispirillum sp.]